jgi:hypothetical protein
MGALDKPFAAVSKALHNALGAKGGVLVKAVRTTNPSTGTATTSEVTQSVTSSPFVAYRLNDINGNTIKAGDTKTTINAADLDFIPDPSTCKFRLGGKEYKIISVDPIFTGDSISTYGLQLRL